MSTLKVNKLRDTAGSADAIVLDPNGGAVLAGVTTVTSVKVGAAVTISESGIEASGIGITCASINGTQIGGRRNIVINGAMMVAQRGTSSTDSGYGTVDRFKVSYSGTDESPTQAQVDVASGTTPYTSGFRKALKITNGNQTSGAGAADFITYAYRVEAQDMANSGWNYTSTSSFITLSFWIKSSVAQSFGCFLRSHDGSQLTFPFETGSLSADTWTKIVKTIPGNASMSFSNDNGTGLEIIIGGFWGTDYTTSDKTLDAWSAYANDSRLKDNTSTWYTTNDATLEITGLQLEVGSQATAFEHRSIGEELALCERYCLTICKGQQYFGTCMLYNSLTHTAAMVWKTEMRTSPTMVANSGTNYYITYRNSGNSQYDSLSGTSTVSATGGGIYTANGSGTAGHAGAMAGQNSNTLVLLTAEL